MEKEVDIEGDQDGDSEQGSRVVQRSFIRLENGLRCCLVEVSGTTSVVACINFAAGSMTDPSQLQGQAHLLEHVTMCTTPSSSTSQQQPCLKDFTAQHAGSCNAETGLMHTSYWLSVPEHAAAEGLECLTHALSQPVTAKAVKVSVDIIDAEFRRARCSSMRALRQLRKSLLMGSPFSQFTCGNAVTLREQPCASGMDVVDALSRHQGQHYTAGKACACLVGPDLRRLEVLARAAFTQMPCPAAQGMGEQAVQAPELLQHSNLLHCPQLPPPGPGLLIAVSSRPRVAPSLDLFWCLPQTSTRGAGRGGWRPWLLAGHLLGHEGRGSLADALKTRGLATKLVVGVQDEVRGTAAQAAGQGFMTWGVQMKLTEAGAAVAGALVVEVHRVLGRIAQLGLEARKQVADELIQVCEARAGSAVRSPREIAQDVAHLMHYQPPDSCVAGSAPLGEYDDAAFSQFLAHLTPGRLMVTVAKPQAAGHQPNVERWFGVPYTAGPLPQVLLDACSAALDGHPIPPSSTSTSDSGTDAARILGSELQLHEDLGVQLPPPPSWALATGINLYTAATQSPPPAEPSLIIDTAELQLWHTLDTRFGPKAHCFIHIQNPSLSSSLAAHTCSLLAVAAVRAHIALDMACAEELGASVSLACLRTGICLHLQGFSSLVPRMLELLLQAVVQLGNDEQLVHARYNKALEGECARLEGWCTSTPASHAQYAAHHALRLATWHNLDVLALIRSQLQPHSSSRESVQQPPSSTQPNPAQVQASLRMWRGVPVEMLLYGSMGAQEAQHMAGMACSLLAPHSTADSTQLQAPRHDDGLPPVCQTSGADAAGAERCVVHEARNPNPANTSSAVHYLLMARPGAQSAEDAARTELLAAVMSQRAITALRAEQRLGYAVACGPAKLPPLGVGIRIQVQSPHASAQELRTRIQAFLQAFRTELAGMTPEQLQTYKAGLESRLLARPHSLEAAARQAWQPIRQMTYLFKNAEEQAAALEQLQLQDMLTFHESLLGCGAALCCQTSLPDRGQDRGRAGQASRAARAQGRGRQAGGRV